MVDPARRPLAPAEQEPKRRLRIGRKLSIAIDAMVFDGADLQTAAAVAKTKAAVIRGALLKRHVRNHVKARREVLITHETARNPRRLAQLRDQSDNIAGAVKAAQLLEEMGDAAATSPHRPMQRTPGIVIIVERGPSAEPVPVAPIEQRPGMVIEHEPTPERLRPFD